MVTKPLSTIAIDPEVWLTFKKGCAKKGLIMAKQIEIMVKAYNEANLNKTV